MARERSQEEPSQTRRITRESTTKNEDEARFLENAATSRREREVKRLTFTVTLDSDAVDNQFKASIVTS